jgi:hypothetical protein
MGNGNQFNAPLDEKREGIQVGAAEAVEQALKAKKGGIHVYQAPGDQDNEIAMGAAKTEQLARERAAAQAAIAARYQQLGRSLSPLGRLVSEQPSVSQDGRSYQMDYRGGHLVFDTATGQVQGTVTSVAEIVYKGLKCFGTQGDGADETYAIISVTQTDPYYDGDQIKVASYRVPEDGVIGDVNPGNAKTEGAGRKFWAEAPQDIILNSVVMEHDYGDPEAVRKAVKDGLQKGADAAASAATGGAANSVPLDPNTVQGMAVDWLAGVLTDFIGAGDESLGSGNIIIARDDWLAGNFPPTQTRDGITYNYVQYCTNGDASYDVMYEVQLRHTMTPL